MNKIIFALMFALASVATQADEVFMTNSSNDTEAWYGYTDTFSRGKDFYSILIVKRYITVKKNSERVYAAATVADCEKGFGSLYLRENPMTEWKIISQFRNVTSNEEDNKVVDIIASNICNLGQHLDKLEKTVKKRQPTNS